MSRAVVAFTPNLAVDRTLRLDRPLSPGSLHRVRERRERAGGKGVNLARAVRELGGDVVVAGFLGGWNGKKFRALLDDEGVPGVFAQVEGETRECHALLGDEGHPTEINEAGTEVSVAHWRDLVARLPAGEVVISGSLPPGIGAETFAALLRELPEPPTVDASGAALEAALSAEVALVAPNRAELAALLNRDSVTVHDAVTFYGTRGVPLLLSLGAEGAAFVGERSYLAHAPAVEADNPVGSGDCLLGAFLWAREQGADLRDALRWGVAAGSDNARRGGGGNLRRAGVQDLYALTRCEELD